MPDAAPLIVFADDWGRHPSSCQHLVTELVARRRVTWVNTIGMRPPRLNWATAKRGWEKLRSWFQASGGAFTRRQETGDRRQGTGGNEISMPSLSPVSCLLSPDQVLNPLMWPSFRGRFGRGLNRRLLARAVRHVTKTGPPPVVVTTLPLVADLVGRVRAARWVYYCVDDFAAWPGLDGRTLGRMEAELVAKVDVAVAVSETLRVHLAKLGRPAHLLTHGVDLDFWRTPAKNDTPPSLREVLAAPGPLVVFWGVIDRRTDVAFVRKLGESLTEGAILLVGPRDDPDPELVRIPRVRFVPPLPFEDLPALAARAAVLIAPYADLPVTRAMQPLKLKEYLATGRPAVVRRLPATEPWADCADVVDTPDTFAGAVSERLRTGLPEGQRRARERLKAESWAAKAEQFERWVDGQC
jgi:hypothetical protein